MEWPLVALTMAIATSFGLFALGRRYLREYIARHGVQPPSMWMFRRSDDPELERVRRAALTLLPFYVIGAAIYLLRP